jgi:hypothetical protein
MSDISNDWLKSPRNNLSDDLMKDDNLYDKKINSNNFLSPKIKKTENSIFQSAEKPFLLDSNSNNKNKKSNFQNKMPEEYKQKKMILDPFQFEKFSDKTKLNPSANVIIIKDNENFREKSFQKQISKIKFFWRGTNFNYPYTFLKFIPEDTEDNESVVVDDNTEFFCFEDYSKKKINPSEKFYS